MAGKADFYADGQWNFYCDLCGAKNTSNNGVKTWDNFYVCRHHKEQRNPQDFVRGIKDVQTVPWTRPNTTPTFVPVCWLWDRSSYADLGTADCMLADFQPLTYAMVYSMKYPINPWLVPDIASSAIPGYAIPGYALPNTVLPTTTEIGS